MSKYEDILLKFIGAYPETATEDFPNSQDKENITKEKVKRKIKEDEDRVQKSCRLWKKELGGRVVYLLYDECYALFRTIEIASIDPSNSLVLLQCLCGSVSPRLHGADEGTDPNGFAFESYPKRYGSLLEKIRILPSPCKRKAYRIQFGYGSMRIRSRVNRA